MEQIDRMYCKAVAEMERSTLRRVFIDQEPERIKAIDESNPMVEFIANTDNVDLDRDVIVPDGAWYDPSSPDDLERNSYFFVNKALVRNHSYQPEDTIGRLRKAELVDLPNARAWKVTATLVRLKSARVPVSDVLELARNGLLKWSVGLRDATARDYDGTKDPDRYKSAGMVVDSWNWWETSATIVPINAMTPTTGVRVDQKAASRLDNALCKGIISTDIAEVFGVERPRTSIIVA